jgi:sialate O-acetylesterase
MINLIGVHFNSLRHGTSALSVLFILCIQTVYADVKLPAIISDNMVLQQKSKVKLWGWAAPGERVTIIAGWRKSPQIVLANKSGNWLVSIPTIAAGGGAYTITFKATNTIDVKNVLLGEVWFCSGQSNMEFTLAKSPIFWETGVNNFEKEVLKVNNPNIRMFTVQHAKADSSLADVKGDWLLANPKNAQLFSAVAWYFGRELNVKTGYPIGLINTSWGGTPAESWTKKEVLEADPELKVILSRYQENLKSYPQDFAQYKVKLQQWQKDSAIIRFQGHIPPKPPTFVIDPLKLSPYTIYNAMVAPIIAYSIKSFIWYQGEANAPRAYQYRKLFPAMIKNWREDHNDMNLPFYFVQISPHQSQNPEIREAQLITWQTVPRTGMTVTIDNGDSANIHPRNKELVGKRLSLWPLSHVYGYKNIPYSGPIYRSMKIDGSSIRLYFDYVANGLVAKNGNLTEFTIAGDDQIFHLADAKIVGNTIVVKSASVPKPIAVRFAWRNVPLPNLYNSAELPASPFRTDDWPLTTQGVN